ncbi:hypothetical protein PYW08_012074 [Mythimna loreyi]|uniref:Uncharacterized protein n=1 Tax=Mythimna loreyi TaxID=667449 RepID=A0ACC2PZM3_9NEOP|nr:hypothetical protein PYW08_012074 [Mythimna loreyi]
MNTIVSPEKLDTVCEGCLSEETHLISEVTDVVVKKLYYEILKITVEDIDSLKLRLCEECQSNILKFDEFKRQVIEAHDILNKYLVRELKPSLSRSPKYPPLEPDTSTHQVAQSESFVHDGPHVPLAFIKVEETDDGDFFMDDAGRGDDDKEFTTVLTTDLTPNKLKLRVRSKSSRSKKSAEEDFDASDDEPLKNKKRAVEGAEKRGRKRKKEDGTPKVDRRKHPAPKKEKPAGVVDNQRVRNKLKRLNVAPGQLEMQVLSWDEVEAERQKALASITFTRHEYRCYDCALGFNHRFKLTNHMKKHDVSAGEFVCSVCRVRCKDSHSLCAHRRRHRVRWRCVVCGATSSRADVAADHVAREHGAPPPTHTCRVCGDTKPSFAKLRNHMKNHGERQKCELCGKSFRDRTSLRTHLFIHAGSKEYACPRCDKRFLFKKAMEVHLVTHDAPAHLYCLECDMNFKNRMSFTQHMKYSLKHVDPAKLKYACPVCNKRFMKASRLEEHNVAVHLKATPISCSAPNCDFACASRPVLRTHTRMVHRGGRSVRNHVCHACGKAYMTKKTLEGHLRSHTGERPFKCTQCASTFGYEAALYNHNKLVHLNAKPPRARAPPSPHAVCPRAPHHVAVCSPCVQLYFNSFIIIISLLMFPLQASSL